MGQVSRPFLHPSIRARRVGSFQRRKETGEIIMKRLFITLASMMCLASFAGADNIDKAVQDAIKHGAHGKTYAQMRSMVELGCHYDVKHNDWTTEPDDRLPSDWSRSANNRHWMVF